MNGDGANELPRADVDAVSVLVTAGLSDYKLSTKLEALAASPAVSEIVLVRRSPLPGLKKVRNVTPPKPLRRGRVLFELWRFMTLWREARRTAAPVVIGIQLVLHGVHAVLVACLTRRHAVTCPIGKDIHDFARRRWLGIPLRWALRHSSRIVVMGPRSREIATRIKGRGDVIDEIQNLQPLQRFTPAPAETDARWDFITVGDLIPRKQVDLLVRAMRVVLESHPTVTLAIVGDGPEKRALERLTKELGLVEQIHFLGKSDSVEYHLQRARAFVLSSRMEALPAAALEAMYCGLPTVLPDICDIPGYFRHKKNALLYAANSREDLAASLRTLLDDPQLRLRLASGALATRHAYAEQWSRKNTVRAWTTVLEKTIRSR